MAGSENKAEGRLAGNQAASYVRAVNEPEGRASRFTAGLMLTTDLAYLLCSADLGLMPAAAAKRLSAAVLGLLDELPTRDVAQPRGDVVAQREKWVGQNVTKGDANWFHLGPNLGESLRNYLPHRRLIASSRMRAVLLHLRKHWADCARCRHA